MSEFIVTVTEETNKWIDAVIKVAASESAENAALLTEWANKYITITEDALSQLDAEAVASIKEDLVARLNKSGLSV
jgi:phenol hydroxylase P1 protein